MKRSNAVWQTKAGVGNPTPETTLLPKEASKGRLLISDRRRFLTSGVGVAQKRKPGDVPGFE
ncbi:MAG: hypothetical protein ACREUX_24770 [Burkholderiales bacterium]